MKKEDGNHNLRGHSASAIQSSVATIGSQKHKELGQFAGNCYKIPCKPIKSSVGTKILPELIICVGKEGLNFKLGDKGEKKPTTLHVLKRWTTGKRGVLGIKNLVNVEELGLKVQLVVSEPTQDCVGLNDLLKVFAGELSIPAKKATDKNTSKQDRQEMLVS